MMTAGEQALDRILSCIEADGEELTRERVSEALALVSEGLRHAPDALLLWLLTELARRGGQREPVPPTQPPLQRASIGYPLEY